MTSARSGPLSDLVIIDCTMALAGPFGSAILADLGADVIKVEPPSGDIARPSPPLPADYVPAAKAGAEPHGSCDYGGYFASINRNKRSIALDLKDPGDRETFQRLCDKADVLLENTRAGVMNRLGLSYEVLRERNPGLVYAALRGFGDERTGKSPYVDWPAFDIVAQAMGGFAHVNGPPGAGGYPGGASIGDLYPGTLMALGVLAAVHHARRTGEGQFLDVAMVDSVQFLCETVIANYGASLPPDRPPRELGPRGQNHPNLSPFGIFPASDGAIAIAAPLPAQWKKLCQLIGREDLIDDERTADFRARRANQAFVEEALGAWTEQRTRAEILDVLGGEVPCGPVQTAADIFADPHTSARQMLATVETPGMNPDATIVGNPIKFTETPSAVRHRAPLLDEHRSQILEQFGLEPELETEGDR